MRVTNAAVAWVLVALGFSGCTAETEPTSQSTSQSASQSTSQAREQRYEVRGIVRELPTSDGATRRLRIEHETIPEFVGIDGSVEGMASMTMGMALAADVDVPPQLVVGDKVEFVLDVDWERRPTGLIVGLSPLPPDLVLDLE